MSVDDPAHRRGRDFPYLRQQLATFLRVNAGIHDKYPLVADHKR